MPRPSRPTPEGKAYFDWLAEQGTTQYKFAREIGVSDGYLSNWASGVYGISLRKILERFPADLAKRILIVRRDALQKEINKL